MQENSRESKEQAGIDDEDYKEEEAPLSWEDATLQLLNRQGLQPLEPWWQLQEQPASIQLPAIFQPASVLPVAAAAASSGATPRVHSLLQLQLEAPPRVITAAPTLAHPPLLQLESLPLVVPAAAIEEQRLAMTPVVSPAAAAPMVLQPLLLPLVIPGTSVEGQQLATAPVKQEQQLLKQEQPLKQEQLVRWDQEAEPPFGPDLLRVPSQHLPSSKDDVENDDGRPAKKARLFTSVGGGLLDVDSAAGGGPRGAAGHPTTGRVAGSGSGYRSGLAGPRGAAGHPPSATAPAPPPPSQAVTASSP